TGDPLQIQRDGSRSGSFDPDRPAQGIAQRLRKRRAIGSLEVHFHHPRRVTERLPQHHRGRRGLGSHRGDREQRECQTNAGGSNSHHILLGRGRQRQGQVQQPRQHLRILPRLALVVVVEKDVGPLRLLSQLLDLRDPLGQLVLSIQVIVPLVRLLVLPPLGGI